MGKNGYKLSAVFRKKIAFLKWVKMTINYSPWLEKIYLSQMGENDHKLPAMLREKKIIFSNG